MKMLGAMIACGLLLASTPGLAQGPPAAPAAQLDPANLALGNEIIELAFPPASRRAMLLGAVDTMMAQARAAARETSGGRLDPGLERIVDRHIALLREVADRLIVEHTPPIFVAMARAYARNFTHDELLQIRAFVRAPAGAKYLQKSMELLADPDIAAANTAYMTQAFAVLEPLQAQLRRELEDYIRNPQARGARPRT